MGGLRWEGRSFYHFYIEEDSGRMWVDWEKREGMSKGIDCGIQGCKRLSSGMKSVWCKRV